MASREQEELRSSLRDNVLDGEKHPPLRRHPLYERGQGCVFHMKKTKKTNENIAISVSVNTIIGNALLTVFKMFAGIYGHSSAMIADAVHSLSDVLSTVIVMVGIKFANRKPDKNHPYGHERFECVAAILLAVLLFFTGAGIGWAGIGQIMSGEYGGATIPGMIALAAAVATIISKEAMYWYTRQAAKKINSGALMADAWHHRSDALSSVGSFAGILGARLGFPLLDPIAAIVICVFIIKVAFDIFKDAIGKMTDKSCSEETEEKMRQVILSHETVLGIDLLMTRLFGDKIYVDAEIRIDDSTTLHDAHETAHNVHDAIEAEFPNVKHCSVHVNPEMKIVNYECDSNNS